ncbi:hypothetical protein KVT40_001674, partial [Elsinoe batatas]
MNSLNKVGDQGPIFDLAIPVKTFSGRVNIPAYGPANTKVLAAYDSFDVGKYVITNADNLAQYWLARWVTQKIGAYPQDPRNGLQPIGDPWQGLKKFEVQNGELTLLDASDAAIVGLDALCPDCFDEKDVVPVSKVIATYQADVPTIPVNVPDEGDNGGQSASGSGGLMIAVASYTNPLGDPAAWQRLISYDTSKLSILVANVLNGPDYMVDKSWSLVIQQAAASGKTVIGYVRTGYLGVSQQKFKTRLGSSNLADWASQIEQDVDKWFELYPGNIGGIFFDEGWPECGPNNIYSDLYAHINTYTKRKHPGAYTVLNPGSPMAQCFEDTMDMLLTFESSYETYTSAFTPNDWTPKDDHKIWHIIYRVPQEKIGEIAELARSRHARYVEMTNDDNPNPYDNVPADSYIQATMSAVASGTVGVLAAKQSSGSYVAGIPADVSVVASDYTSVTLAWSSVPDALGLTRATVGMLQPGSSGLAFEVKTVLSSGSGGSPTIVSARTKSLPNGGSIAIVKHTRSGNSVIYTADVLVPYAFVRLFISAPHRAVGAARGWPIDAGTNADTGIGQWKLASYLVEGNDFYSGFYKYSGSYIEAGSSNADWTWTPQGTNVPLGDTDALPNDYAIQGQGYAPIQNIFGGTMRSYKCEGQH